MAPAPRILIVEDNAGVRRFFERILAEDGYSVDAVATGRHALLLLREMSFDLVIVDMSLPDCDGLEIMRQIVSDYGYIKLLATSGFMDSRLKSMALVAGAAAVCAKPISPHDFRAKVYEVLDPSCSWRSPAAD